MQALLTNKEGIGMNLYLISQEYVGGYDTYDSVVVSAENEADAKTIHPSSFVTHINNDKFMGTYSGGDSTGQEYEFSGDDWVSFSEIDKIEVELLGVSDVDRGVILASFNAG